MRNREKDAAEKAERRERLLEAGFRLFAARSIEAVRLSEIAAEAGVGIVTLYRYFRTKPDLVIELATKKWIEYYAEVERAYAARGGGRMDAAAEMAFFIDSVIGLYRRHRDLLRFNRNFDAYVMHEECTAEQMRPYNEAVNVFAKKFHTVYRKAKEDGTLDTSIPEKRLFVNTLYTFLSVAGKYAEGLIYPPNGPQDLLDELLLLKRIVLGAVVRRPPRGSGVPGLSRPQGTDATSASLPAGPAPAGVPAIGRAGLVPAAPAADATSASLPVRHRPSRNSVLVRSDNRPVVLFVTVVANGRQRVFDDPAAVSCILSAWDEVRDWIVGRYVVMPDHIHFSCAPGDPSIPDFHRWMRKWKSLVARTFPVPHATPLWQRNCWDVQLRNGESYAAKWHYIVENPVRKGLVASPADWPYQGELNVLEWYDR